MTLAWTGMACQLRLIPNFWLLFGIEQNLFVKPGCQEDDFTFPQEI
jgi:hypothetical protein